MAGWAWVQDHATSGSSVSSLAVVIGAPVNGNILAVTVASTPSTGTTARTVSTVVCTNVSGFTQISSKSTTGPGVEIWVGNVGASAASPVTVTMSAKCAVLKVGVLECSGGSSTSDAITAGTTGTSGSASSTGAYTVNSPNALLIGAENATTDAADPASGLPPSGFSNMSASSGAYWTIYQLNASAGAKSSAAWTGSNTTAWCSTLQGLKHPGWKKGDYWWQRATESSGVF